MSFEKIVTALVVCCICMRVVLSDTHTCSICKVDCWFSFTLCLLFVHFCRFVPVLFAFVVLAVVSSVVLSRETGKEQRLRNALFVARKTLTQSINQWSRFA